MCIYVPIAYSYQQHTLGMKITTPCYLAETRWRAMNPESEHLERVPRRAPPCCRLDDDTSKTQNEWSWLSGEACPTCEVTANGANGTNGANEADEASEA